MNCGKQNGSMEWSGVDAFEKMKDEDRQKREELRKLREENRKLREELEHVCSENKLLWAYRLKGDPALQTEKECMDWQISEYDLEVKSLEVRLDKATEIAATLTEALGIIVKLGERLKNCPCRKEPVENG